MARTINDARCDDCGLRWTWFATHGRLGANQACLAARDAISTWSRLPGKPANPLPQLIRAVWELRTAPTEPDRCATTCLFAAATVSQTLIVGGLGDGLALVRFPDGGIRQLIGRGNSFTNETLALGVPHKRSDWCLEVMTVSEPNTAVVLATDGIADDLVEDRVGDFANWLCERFLPMPPMLRHRSLLQQLRNWPTPNHQDDKTVAVLFHTALPRGEL